MLFQCFQPYLAVAQLVHLKSSLAFPTRRPLSVPILIKSWIVHSLLYIHNRSMGLMVFTIILNHLLDIHRLRERCNDDVLDIMGISSAPPRNRNQDVKTHTLKIHLPGFSSTRAALAFLVRRLRLNEVEMTSRNTRDVKLSSHPLFPFSELSQRSKLRCVGSGTSKTSDDLVSRAKKVGILASMRHCTPALERGQ